MTVKGLNISGLKRSGFRSLWDIVPLKKAYQIPFRSGLKLEEALARIEAECPTPHTLHLVEFIRRSDRGVCRTSPLMPDAESAEGHLVAENDAPKASPGTFRSHGPLSINRWSWIRCALGRVDSKNGSSHKKLLASRQERGLHCRHLRQLSAVVRSGPEDAGVESGLLRSVLETTSASLWKFPAAGAEKVVSIDRFFSRRDRERERQIYPALRETLDPKERILFDEAVDLQGGVQLNPDRLACVREGCRASRIDR